MPHISVIYKFIIQFISFPRQHETNVSLEQQNRTALTCIQGDVGRVDHFIFQTREERTPLFVKERKGIVWEEKTKCQHVESIMRTEIVHHCFQAKLWHVGCYRSQRHHRIDLMLGFCINTLSKREREKRKVWHVEREQETWDWRDMKEGKEWENKSNNRNTWENRLWAEREWRGRSSYDLNTERGMGWGIERGGEREGCYDSFK